MIKEKITFEGLQHLYLLCSRGSEEIDFLKFLFCKNYNNFEEHLSIMIDSDFLINTAEGVVIKITNLTNINFNKSLFLHPKKFSYFHIRLYDVIHQIDRIGITSFSENYYYDYFSEFSFLVDAAVLTQIDLYSFKFSDDSRSDFDELFISKKQLEKYLKNAKLKGDRAELFVLSEEIKRLKKYNLKDNVKHISVDNEAAGYDIESWTVKSNINLKRFIEVKSLDQNSGFYLSNNERRVAKKYGILYYVYLVEEKNGFFEIVNIIQNPELSVFNNPNSWNIDSDGYYISPNKLVNNEKKLSLSW